MERQSQYYLFRMTEFEYWQLPGKAVDTVIRHCFRGILTNNNFDADDNFTEALLEKFPYSNGKVTFITKSGLKQEIEKYLIKPSEKTKLEAVTHDKALDGKYLVALIDDGYLYEPPDGYNISEENWVRINTQIQRNRLQIGIIPLINDNSIVEIDEDHKSIVEREGNKYENKIKNEIFENKSPTNMHVFNTRTENISQAGKLTLKMPTFSPDTENVIEVLDKLEKLLPMTGNQIQAVIVNFIQNSGLDHLLLSLQNDELTNFEKFRNAMINRYSQANNATQFYLISQLGGEHELDLLARIQRAWLRLKGEKQFTKSDEGIVTERFVSALNDPQIRLKLRELAPTYQMVAEKARQIRLAKEHEETQPGQIKEQITLLTREIEKLKMTCRNCGLGHETKNCRANQKMKTQFNKEQRSERPRQQLKHFKTHFPKVGNQDGYKVRFPPAVRTDNRWPNKRYNQRTNQFKYNQNNQYNLAKRQNNPPFRSYSNNRGNRYNKRGYQNRPSFNNRNQNSNINNKYQTYFTGVEEPIFEESF